jgi:hypothetical protein
MEVIIAPNPKISLSISFVYIYKLYGRSVYFNILGRK